ncbi:MAG: paraquat-inducible protein A [Pseudomonadota bacterium]
MKNIELSIVGKYPEEAKHLRFVLGITLLLLAGGLVAPIITLHKFVLIENTFSVLGGTIDLLKDGQIFLFIVISGFSILVPLLKIGVLNKLLTVKANKAGNLGRYLHWMHLYGKWSMLDVFVVAVLVVAVKLGTIANVEMRFGLYLFAAAVLLTMYVTARVASLTNRLNSE